jgi:hypothetical protein
VHRFPLECLAANAMKTIPWFSENGGISFVVSHLTLMETKLTTTKILLEQILIVFTVVLAATWFTIESKASWLGFQTQLGRRWLEFTGMPVYLPPTFLRNIRRGPALPLREAILMEEPKLRPEFALFDRSTRMHEVLRLVPRLGAPDHDVGLEL